MSSENWEDLYVLAAKESDGAKMAERVAAAREAIQTRLQGLNGSTNHHEERVMLKTTLQRLGSLQADAQNW